MIHLALRTCLNDETLNQRYVSAEPKWAKQLEGNVKMGKHLITFSASSPIGDEVKIFYNNRKQLENILLLGFQLQHDNSCERHRAPEGDQLSEFL